jgi:hypothetical protein
MVIAHSNIPHKRPCRLSDFAKVACYSQSLSWDWRPGFLSQLLPLHHLNAALAPLCVSLFTQKIHWDALPFKLPPFLFHIVSQWGKIAWFSSLRTAFPKGGGTVPWN